MVLSDGLAIGVGWLLGSRLPDRIPRMVAAVVFLLFGAWSTWTGGSRLPPLAWVGGGIFVLGSTLILFRGTLFRRSPPED